MKISRKVLLTLSWVFSIVGLCFMFVSAKELKVDPTNALQHIERVKFVESGSTATATLVQVGDRLVGVRTDKNFTLSKEGEDKNINNGVTGSTILGGIRNILSGSYNVILGGSGNHVDGAYNVVLGGSSNKIDGGKKSSAILGGDSNRISKSNFSVIVGGSGNKVKGNGNNGYSVVVGSNSFVSGNYSVAAGVNSKVIGDSSFLWTDRNHTGTILKSGVFAVVADSGMVIGTNVAHSFAQLTLNGGLVLSEGNRTPTCNTGLGGTIMMKSAEGKMCLCSCDGEGWSSMFGLGECRSICDNKYDKPECGTYVAKLCSGSMNVYSGSCIKGEIQDGTGAYFVDKYNNVHWSCQTDNGEVENCSTGVIINEGCINGPVTSNCTGNRPEGEAYLLGAGIYLLGSSPSRWTKVADDKLSLAACEWKCNTEKGYRSNAAGTDCEKTSYSCGDEPPQCEGSDGVTFTGSQAFLENHMFSRECGDVHCEQCEDGYRYVDGKCVTTETTAIDINITCSVEYYDRHDNNVCIDRTWKSTTYTADRPLPFDVYIYQNRYYARLMSTDNGCTYRQLPKTPDFISSWPLAFSSVEYKIGANRTTSTRVTTVDDVPWVGGDVGYQARVIHGVSSFTGFFAGSLYFPGTVLGGSTYITASVKTSQQVTDSDGNVYNLKLIDCEPVECPEPTIISADADQKSYTYKRNGGGLIKQYTVNFSNSGYVNGEWYSNLGGRYENWVPYDGGVLVPENVTESLPDHPAMNGGVKPWYSSIPLSISMQNICRNGEKSRTNYYKYIPEEPEPPQPPKTYTVKFNCNTRGQGSDVGVMGDQIFDVDVPQRLRENTCPEILEGIGYECAPYKVPLKFAGWSETPVGLYVNGGAHVDYNDKELINYDLRNNPYDETVTLYAVWTRKYEGCRYNTGIVTNGNLTTVSNCNVYMTMDSHNRGAKYNYDGWEDQACPQGYSKLDSRKALVLSCLLESMNKESPSIWTADRIINTLNYGNPIGWSSRAIDENGAFRWGKYVDIAANGKPVVFQIMKNPNDGSLDIRNIAYILGGRGNLGYFRCFKDDGTNAYFPPGVMYF